MMWARFCVVIALIAVMQLSGATRPKYIGCVDQSECGLGTCCVLAPHKFSIPQCRAHGEFGQPCRVPGEDEERDGRYSTTLYYPDRQVVNVTDVFPITCPCALGLYCSPETLTCSDPHEESKFNGFDNFNDLN